MDSGLDRLSQIDVPGCIHGELFGHQIYENGTDVYLIARDGYRVRDTNRAQNRQGGTSQIVLVDLRSGQALWKSELFGHGPLLTGGIYPKLRHGWL